MRHLIALLCLCPLAMPKTVTISNIVERRDMCVASVVWLVFESPPPSFAQPPAARGRQSIDACT